MDKWEAEMHMQAMTGRYERLAARRGLSPSEMRVAEKDHAQYDAAWAAAEVAASLVVEEQRQAKAAQQAKQQRKGKKARQKQRKQVLCPCSWDGCRWQASHKHVVSCDSTLAARWKF